MLQIDSRITISGCVPLLRIRAIRALRISTLSVSAIVRLMLHRPGVLHQHVMNAAGLMEPPSFIVLAKPAKPPEATPSSKNPLPQKQFIFPHARVQT